MSVSIIENIRQYINLSSSEADRVLACARLRKLRRKQILLQEGDVGHARWYVQTGCLYGYDLNDNGEVHVIKFAVENTWISDMHSFLTGQPSRLNIETVEASEVWEVNKSAWDQLYLAIPQLERYGRILMETAFVAMQDRVLAGISQTAEARYVAFAESSPLLNEHLPQYLIASYLGITPEFLSKIKKKIASRS